MKLGISSILLEQEINCPFIHDIVAKYYELTPFNSDFEMPQLSGIIIHNDDDLENKLRTNHPHIPLIKYSDLEDSWTKETFFIQVTAYKDFNDFLPTCETIKDLVEFHKTYKYFVLAKQRDSYKELGDVLSNHTDSELDSVIEEYKSKFYQINTSPNSFSKTYNSLESVVSYFRRTLTKPERDVVLKVCKSFKSNEIPFIKAIKVINFYVDKHHNQYLKNQKFLKPFPEKLILNNL